MEGGVGAVPLQGKLLLFTILHVKFVILYKSIYVCHYLYNVALQNEISDFIPV